MNRETTRVMWLLNHSTARKCEVHLLKKIGFTEIFLPKICPSDPFFRSSSIDYSEDANLTIPEADLAIMNQTDWYSNPSPQAWDIANQYFDIVFFILYSASTFQSMTQHFRGAMLWRVYGKESRYTGTLGAATQTSEKKLVESLGRRFWFAQAYDHLHLIESDYLARRQVSLPLGLLDCAVRDQWEGNDRRIFFVCPDIGWISYYHQIYTKFISDFRGMPYAIGGTQSIHVSDPAVLGFIPRSVYEENMRQMRVMFYHSSEPNHIHYHPFEAIRAGMPLVFMSGGILDRLGGTKLPGRCKTIAEARTKIQRILKDDWKLIDHIRQSQVCLLEGMNPKNFIEAWDVGFDRILQDLEYSRRSSLILKAKPKRIAVIIPIAYGGGSLRGTKLLLQAIARGSQNAGESIELVLGCLEKAYDEVEFQDLDIPISIRTYEWCKLTRDQATQSLIYAGFEVPSYIPEYQVPDDGMEHFMDCDLWIFISDRLERPLLPVRPYVLMLYDYIQRHETLLKNDENDRILAVSHAAQRILVTTQFTQSQAINFARVPKDKVNCLPMLIPEFKSQIHKNSTSQFSSQSSSQSSLSQSSLSQSSLSQSSSTESGYFLWTTNCAIHKNHLNALKALKIYYEKLEGTLLCYVTGIDTQKLIYSEIPHLKPLVPIWESSQLLRERTQLLGDLSDSIFQRTMENSQFLWHPARIDNGTFSVVEAAQLGIPSLSSDYPPMREIDSRFQLNLTWMDPHNPLQMAQQLKFMESHRDVLRSKLPDVSLFQEYSVDNMANQYWEVIGKCL